jgi:hypothetical protein
MLIPFGILSAAGAGVEGATYELIESEILAATASSVVFSSLATYASTYKHLQIRVSVRTNRGATTDPIRVRFNSDSGNNYAFHLLSGNGNTVTSTNSSSTTGLQIPRFNSATSIASGFGVAVIDFLDVFSTTKNKTIRAFGGTPDESMGLVSGLFLSTNTTSELELTPFSGTLFEIGCRFSLYGIRG